MILIIRPRDDALALKNKMAELGIVSHVDPLFEVQYLQFDIKTLKCLKVVVTSKNAVLSLASQFDDRSVSLYTMTDKIAEVARNNGFVDVVSCGCKVVLEQEQYLKKHLDPDESKIVYLSGSEITADLVSSLTEYGFNASRVINYRMQPKKGFSDETVQLLREGQIKDIAIFSVRAAIVCKDLLLNAGLEPNKFTYFVLSKRIASVLECKNVFISSSPTQSEFIGMLQRTMLCCDSTHSM